MEDTSATFFDTSARHTLSFEDYSQGLMDVLAKNGAPKMLIDAMTKMEETILRDRVYTAPEALCDSTDKTRLFEAFCDFDLLSTSGTPSSPRKPWQQAAYRDMARYPSAAHYEIVLPEVLNDVVGVSLVQCVFPKSQPVINEQACWLDFAEQGSPAIFSVCLDPGNVSAKSFVYLLNVALASGLWKNTYLVAIDSVSNKISFTASGSSAVPFRLLFGTGPNAENSLAPLLGFPVADTTFGLVQTAVGHVNLASSLFVDFAMDNLPSIAAKRVVSRQTGAMQARNVLARVPLDCVTGSIKYYYADACDLLHNYFQPIKLDRVTMRLINDKGRPYLPDGLDHSLTLEIVQLSMAFKNDILTSQQPVCKQVTLNAPLASAIKAKEQLPEKDSGVGKKVVAAAALVGLGSAAYYLFKDPQES